MKPTVQKLFWMIFGLFLLSLATERQAAAYADPGTGAMLWQLLAAAAVGATFYVRKVTSWFRRKKEPEK